MSEKETKEAGKERKKTMKPVFTEVDIQQCVFADEYFLLEEGGKPRYQDMEVQWNTFITWIEKTAERKKEEGTEDSLYIYDLGQEVIKWARMWDVYALYILTKLHWISFRDNYMTKEAPEIVREIMDGIMAKKMTEEQKWGNKEERRLKGQLIIFENAGMTPEESYHLAMKEKRRKYDPQKHAALVAEGKNKLPEHEIVELNSQILPS